MRSTSFHNSPSTTASHVSASVTNARFLLLFAHAPPSSLQRQTRYFGGGDVIAPFPFAVKQNIWHSEGNIPLAECLQSDVLSRGI